MLFDIAFLKAIILGVIEGLTEFIPVSSTAHLLVSSKLISFVGVKNNLFEIAIQSGAIMAVALLYRKKLILVAKNCYNHRRERKFAINIAIAFLPAAILGFLLHRYIKEFLFGDVVIAISLIAGGIVMIVVEKLLVSRNSLLIQSIDGVGYKHAFLIGLLQAVAMIPGVSRSGATIIGAMSIGIQRKVATEFSFFLAIPTILAASLYDLYKNFDNLDTNSIYLILVGFISSFISSLFVIRWFIGFVSKYNFIPFAIYRILLGLLILYAAWN